MLLDRRRFTLGAAAMTVGACSSLSKTAPTTQGERHMYGLIGKMTAATGQRDALIAILLESTTAMPGCLSYVVAKDAKDADAIWITEVWDSKDNHAASLSLPEVKAAIAKARPIIAGFGDYFTTEPVGGFGLSNPAA
jgi:quinol monooxygenase YgiN